jgi:hypothetical protein
VDAETRLDKTETVSVFHKRHRVVFGFYRHSTGVGGMAGTPLAVRGIGPRSRRPSIQLRSVESPTPTSAATSRRDCPLVCANRTASARNSGVKVYFRSAIGTLLFQEKSSPFLRSKSSC